MSQLSTDSLDDELSFEQKTIDRKTLESLTKDTVTGTDEDGASNFRKVDVKDRLAEVNTSNIVAAGILCVIISGITFSSYESDSRASLQTLEQTYKMGQLLADVKNNKLNDENEYKKDALAVSNISKIISNIKTGGDGKYRQLDKWEGADLKELEDSWAISIKNFDEISKMKTSALAGKEYLDNATKNYEEISLASTQLYTNLIQSPVYKSAFDLDMATNKLMLAVKTIDVDNNVKIGNYDKIMSLIKTINDNLKIIKSANVSQDAQVAIKNYEEATANILKLGTVSGDVENYIKANMKIDELQNSIIGTIKAQEKIITKFGGSALSDSTNVNLSASTGLLDDQSKLRFSQTLLALGILCGMLIAVIFSRRQRQTQILAKELERNQVNENALVELLESIKPLDNGDFTKPITAEDKFLSQIANRIDNTRQQFKEIASLIKSNSEGIMMAAESTENSSTELMDISNKQVTKLDSTIEIVNNITNAMDEIAQIAWIAQEEANKSAERSEAGDELVNQSVQKMGEIRDTIQESAKKIKKLGESAQSITEVTSLIKDITKQINILALNAAIQAASSGEGGREFTIVAQEVQRLADDSEEATQKIEELISEIQSDTAIAIASMEKTTQEVVIGAKLTEEAGKSLQEINNLSKTTSEQIRGVSEKLEEKSQEMAQATFEMRELQKVSDESKEAVNTTSIQVEALRDISDELKITVERFKV